MRARLHDLDAKAKALADERDALRDERDTLDDTVMALRLEIESLREGIVTGI